jgi:MFS family permease
MHCVGVRRDLGLSLGDAVGYGVMAGVAEFYLPAFALAVGVRPVLAGLVATLPLLAGGLLQLLAPRAIARITSLRRWVAICHVVQALAFVPLILLALRGGPAAPIVFVSAALYWAAGMASAAGWTPWMSRVVPARIRSRFFGRRQGLVQAAMLAGLLGAGLALDASRGARAVYAAMFALAMIARLVSALAIARQGQGISPTPRRRMRLRSIPPRLRGTPRATLLGYLLAALVATSISGPFLTPYLFVHEHVTYAGYCMFSATIVVVKIAALPVFGRVIARTGVRRVLMTCALAISAIPLMWAASSVFWWLLVIQLYAGVAWAGFELGMLMTLFDAADDAERTTIQSAFSALQAIGTAGASLIGGTILAAQGGGHAAYTWLFIISAFARLAAAALVVRQLPRVIVYIPFALASRAWTMAIRPWGGTIIRAIAGARDE